MAETQTIREIEEQLIAEGRSERRRWASIADLMMRVEQNELYRPLHKSFTAWVRSIAKAAGLQESTYWRALKAGRYVAALEESGRIEADEVAAGAETVEIAERIERDSNLPEGERQEYVDRALRGDMTRGELRTIWQTSRPQGRQGSPAEAKTNEAAVEAAAAQEDTRPWTESSVIGALYGGFKALSHGPVILSGREIPVASATTSGDRRVDWMALCKSGLVGFEIKVAPHDLEGDRKMGDYRTAVDYLYIAIPAHDDMIELARANAGEGIGIVAVSKANGVQVYKGAAERSPRERSDPNAVLSAAKAIYRMLEIPFSRQ